MQNIGNLRFFMDSADAKLVQTGSASAAEMILGKYLLGWS